MMTPPGFMTGNVARHSQNIANTFVFSKLPLELLCSEVFNLLVSRLECSVVHQDVNMPEFPDSPIHKGITMLLVANVPCYR